MSNGPKIVGDEVARVCKLYKQGYSLHDIVEMRPAHLPKVSILAVRGALVRAGVKLRPKGRRRNQTPESIEGMSKPPKFTGTFDRA